MKTEKVEVHHYKDFTVNSKFAIHSKWVCINGENAGRIAEVVEKPLRGALFWTDINDFVDSNGEDLLFVYKRG